MSRFRAPALCAPGPEIDRVKGSDSMVFYRFPAVEAGDMHPVRSCRHGRVIRGCLLVEHLPARSFAAVPGFRGAVSPAGHCGRLPARRAVFPVPSSSTTYCHGLSFAGGNRAYNQTSSRSVFGFLLRPLATSYLPNERDSTTIIDDCLHPSLKIFSGVHRSSGGVRAAGTGA